MFKHNFSELKFGDCEATGICVTMVSFWVRNFDVYSLDTQKFVFDIHKHVHSPKFHDFF